MDFSQTGTRIKEIIAATRLPPSRRFEMLNLILMLGQWVRGREIAVRLPCRNDLYAHLQKRVIGDSPIDYLEFGVFKGDSMNQWTSLNRHAGSRFHGFDTFDGLPEEWPFFFRTLPAGSFSTQGRIPAVTDVRVAFRKGLFQDVLPGFLAGFEVRNRLVIHCDADLYSSTLYVLATLNPLLARGSILVFDEFSSPYEFRAFIDFTTSFRRRCRVLACAGRLWSHMALELES